ncbi:hypothetical protein Tco_0679100 [Tanacetum coccineum]|uniref:Phospholipase-like protein n=1 Tax=Tanacetum coccineum TaxID=301880 RepID=A0ABQ4XH19_9ASTR
MIILQLVILGVESKRVVPDWMLRLANDRVAWDKYPWGSYVWPTLYSQLRNANVKRWSPLYVDEPTDEDDAKKYSIFGYTWAFKPLVESYRVTAIRYFDRYNRYPRVAAWSKKKGRFLGPMVIPFFEGNMPAARLTPDDNEARSDWWISSRAYFDGFIGQVERVPFDLSRQNMYEIPSDIYREFDEQKREIERNKKEVDNIKEEMRKFREEMNVQPVRQENKEPIIADQHYGLSDFSQFQSMQGGPSSFQGHIDVGESATQYWQGVERLPHGTPIGWLSGEHMNSWMELIIRRRNANAKWTVAYTSTISVHPENNQFIIPTDQHVIGTLDGTTHPYLAWNDVDWNKASCAWCEDTREGGYD